MANYVKYEANSIILFLLLLEMISAYICRSVSHHNSTVLSPHLVKLVTLDIIPMLLIFCGMVTTELIRGEKMFQYVYARTVSDNDGERMTCGQHNTWSPLQTAK